MATIEIILGWTAFHTTCNNVLDWRDGGPFCDECDTYVSPPYQREEPDLDAYVFPFSSRVP
jgi:hypothetical protein